MSSPVEAVMAAFYGENRKWTTNERAAARELVEAERWTPARAAFVAEWLEKDPFWRGKIRMLPDVLRNVDQITAQSGAKGQAPDGKRQAWQAYERYDDPRGPEVEKHIEQTLAEKREAVQRPWLELIDEAQALGLRGPAIFDWVMDQRAKRTGRPRSDYPTSRTFKGVAAKPLPRSEPHWTERDEEDAA